MLIPCIDLQNGQAVQLVHGRKRELAVADVFGLLEKFRRYKWLHIIDLDAAMSKPANDKLVRRALPVLMPLEIHAANPMAFGLQTFHQMTADKTAGTAHNNALIC